MVSLPILRNLFLTNRMFQIVVWCIGMMFFALVAYRATYLSMTIDECGTTDMLDGTFTEIMFSDRFFHSANNHILNSLLMKISTLFFGTSELALRLPNVLSYLLYFIGSYLISCSITKDNLIRIAGIIIFNSMLFVLDFFSLTRGYGLANAFETMSLAMMLLFLQDSKTRYIFWGFFFATLAAYANFTWLNFYISYWAVFNGILLFEVKKSRSFLHDSLLKNAFPLFFAIVLFLLSYEPITILRKQNEFKWGTESWMESFRIFVKNLLYDNHELPALMMQWVLIVLFLVALYACFSLIIKREKLIVEHKNLIFFTILILVMVIASFMQRHLMHTMYPEGRKALFYYPLLVGLLISVFQFYLAKQRFLIRTCVFIIAGLSLFIFFFRLNINGVREWWFDENSKAVSTYVQNHPVNGNNKIAVNWYFQQSFRFYNRFRFNHLIQEISKLDEIQDEEKYAYYYVMGDDIKNVPLIYRPLFRMGWDRFLLVKDSDTYVSNKQLVMRKIQHDCLLSSERVSAIADSVLLNWRKNMDWTQIPLTEHDINE